jgi:hypothetical protein
VSPIPKPEAFDLSAFAVTPATASVQRMPMALPVKKLSDAGDFVRLHGDDRPEGEGGYWSEPLAFVDVPVKGQTKKIRHLILPDLAAKYLPTKLIKYRRLAWGCDPEGKPFICEVPCDNLDNVWNRSNLEACEIAKTQWVRADSKNKDGLEGYQHTLPLNTRRFREPEWPAQPFSEIISTAFKDRVIMSDDHPALLRLIGAELPPS